MNMTSLIIGFILGAIATYFFTSMQKNNKQSLTENVGDAASGINNIDSKNNSSKNNGLMMAAFIAVPILAGLIYFKMGAPQAESISKPSTDMPPIDMGAKMPAAGDGHDMGNMEDMAQKLAAKLEKNPDNAEGWALLAHSYVELKQHKNAVGAFDHAVKLIPNDAQLFADYADALAVTNSGKFDAKTLELIDAALKIDPSHPKALLLAGTGAFNLADYPKAISHWEKLQTIMPKDDAVLAKDVEANIAEAKSLIAKK
jgi:cytochrome c-type biogenesis protein CcmH